LSPLVALAVVELRGLARRRWLLVLGPGGLAVAALIAALAAAADAGIDRADTIQAGGASLLLLGGLYLAIGLGAGALNRDADSGHLGILAAAGPGRARLAGAAIAARVAALAIVLAAWGVALQLASLAAGRGLDGPLAVHTLASAENLLLALLAAAVVSSVVGSVAAGIFGLTLYVMAQAVVNLESAADQNLIGSAETGVRAAYLVLPRLVVSPMIFLLQAREEAGPAAPPLEINGTTVFVQASAWSSVVFTLVWCAAIALVAAVGLRRRPLV
jgi:hypothetical protein